MTAPTSQEVRNREASGYLPLVSSFARTGNRAGVIAAPGPRLLPHPKTFEGTTSTADDRDIAEHGFTAAERAAIKQRAAELREQGGRGSAKRLREAQACLDAIAALEGSDRQIAERLHAVVTEEAPQLDPKTWYGFPSDARDGKVVVFFQPAAKFDTRYGTIGSQRGRPSRRRRVLADGLRHARGDGGRGGEAAGARAHGRGLTRSAGGSGR